ncbi:MAG: CDP-alcohol phosphatidyltransferase family protein [Candidatus Omnitrophica bacterium]|nr:CDP-alcohol phosphatidyltransferase family protein [Candidatus Omnitrophota bacterium]
MITTKYKQFFNRVLEPAAKTLAGTGITPNQITLAGLVFEIFVCLLLVWNGNIILFCLLLFASSLFDALDGAVARVSGRVTKFGAYLDAMCDRIFEGCAAMAVAYVTGYWFLMFLLFMGAVVTSYAKARAAMEVSVSNSEWPDFMERTERGFIFIFGLLISDITKIQIAGRDLFYWITIFLIVAIYVTIIQRVLRAKRLIEDRSSGS